MQLLDKYTLTLSIYDKIRLVHICMQEEFQYTRLLVNSSLIMSCTFISVAFSGIAPNLAPYIRFKPIVLIIIKNVSCTDRVQ